LEWDEEKRRANIQKHGLDFAQATNLDWDNATYIEDTRFPYPEPRYWHLPYGSAGYTWSLSADAVPSCGSSVFAKRTGKRSSAMASKHGKRIVPDGDIPEMAAANFAAAKSLKADMPEVVEAMKRGRGRPKVENPKARVSLRLDPKVVAAYKATGEGWQSRINEILARALPQQKHKRRPSRAA
jgi:uncharacterized protein (DUF4415 family)